MASHPPTTYSELIDKRDNVAVQQYIPNNNAIYIYIVINRDTSTGAITTGANIIFDDIHDNTIHVTYNIQLAAIWVKSLKVEIINGIKTVSANGFVENRSGRAEVKRGSCPVN